LGGTLKGDAGAARFDRERWLAWLGRMGWGLDTKPARPCCPSPPRCSRHWPDPGLRIEGNSAGRTGPARINAIS